MFTVLLTFFLGFAAAFVSVEGVGSDGATVSLTTIYRGILFGDGDGLDFMSFKGDEGHSLGTTGQVMMIGATFFMTLVLVNLSIGVFSESYSTATCISELAYWHELTRYTTEILGSPTWPWQIWRLDDIDDSQEWQDIKENTAWEQLAVGWGLNGWAKLVHLFLQPALTLYEVMMTGHAAHPMTEARQDEVDQLAMWVAGVLGLGILLLITVVLYWFNWAVPCAFSGALTMVVLQSLLSRNKYETPWLENKQYYLWICARNDFDPSNSWSDDVGKGDLDSLQKSIEKLESTQTAAMQKYMEQQMEKMKEDAESRAKNMEAQFEERMKKHMTDQQEWFSAQFERLVAVQQPPAPPAAPSQEKPLPLPVPEDSGPPAPSHKALLAPAPRVSPPEHSFRKRGTNREALLAQQREKLLELERKMCPPKE